MFQCSIRTVRIIRNLYLYSHQCTRKMKVCLCGQSWKKLLASGEGARSNWFKLSHTHEQQPRYQHKLYRLINETHACGLSFETGVSTVNVWNDRALCNVYCACAGKLCASARERPIIRESLLFSISTISTITPASRARVYARNKPWLFPAVRIPAHFAYKQCRRIIICWCFWCVCFYMLICLYSYHCIGHNLLGPVLLASFAHTHTSHNNI